MKKKKLTKLLLFRNEYYSIVSFVYPCQNEEEMPNGNQGNNSDDRQGSSNDQAELDAAQAAQQLLLESMTPSQRALFHHSAKMEKARGGAPTRTFYFPHANNKVVSRTFVANAVGKYQLTSVAMEALAGQPYVHLPADTVKIPSTAILDLFKSASLSMSPTDLHTVWSFMRQSCSLMRHTLAEDWVSFGVVIGYKGDSITPLNLLRIQVMPGANLVKQNSGDTPGELIWDGQRHSAMIALCGLNRVSNASNEAYRKNLADRLSKLTATGGSIVSAAALGSKVMESVVMSKPYRVLCSAIDMYLHYTKDTELNVLRAGTIGTRYSAMVAAPIICSLTENHERLMDFLRWCKETEVKKEVARMLDAENEELDHEHSYTFYAISMGIITSSLWTSSANPNFLWFYHAVHALLGSDRSKNARMTDIHDPTALARSALLFAYIESKRCSVGSGVFSSQEEQEKFEADVKVRQLAMQEAMTGINTVELVDGVLRVDAASNPLLEEPKPDDSVGWHALSMLPNHPVWTKCVIPWGNSRLESLRTSREGTIGESVRNLVGSTIGHVDREPRAMGLAGPVMSAFVPMAPPQ